MNPETEGMRQCILQKDGQEYLAWLPREYAVPGKTVDFRAWGIWKEGWTVFLVYSMILKEDYIREHKS